MGQWFKARDTDLDAYRPLCAYALTFKRNTLLEGDYGDWKQRVKCKIFSWQ